jgi:uncharacterized protein (DUF433 family)
VIEEDEPMASLMTAAKIINRGRGPEIAGTRITVFDVMDYLRQGWHRDRIANLFRLSSRDIQAAIDYVEQHREEVEAAYQRILERHQSYQYPPDLQAKIDRSRGAARRKLDDVRRRRAEESNVAKDHGGS